MPGTRELVAHPSYRLIYNVRGDTVRILRVLHTARRWPPVRG
ncbi:MAG: type II toxin-antitoxin system RelE/ParE family toxin [Amaricoccus sp.]